MATVRCMCLCHCGGLKATHIPPDVRNHVEAITACSRCINAHAIAIVSEWPEPPQVNPYFTPWMDLYPPTDGEGPE